MRRLSWMLVGIGLAVAAFILIMALPQAQAWQSGDAYPGWGDWTIDNPTIVAEETLYVDGSIDVNSQLTLYNSEIHFLSWNDQDYTLNVDTGGSMYVYDSYITDEYGYHYEFEVHGTLYINRSVIYEMWGDYSSWVGGIQLYSDNCRIENSSIGYGLTGGIYIERVSARIYNNNIFYNGYDNYYGYTGYGIYVEGKSGSKSNISNNYIQYNGYDDGSQVDGYGIYSYNQTNTDVIAHNTIYGNGWSSWSYYTYGTQVYLSYSAPTLLDNDLYYGAYCLYADNSNPPTIKDHLFISQGYNWYGYSPNTNYGVYEYNSTLSFDNCKWSQDYNYATQFGVYANGPSSDSASNITLKNCDFNYSISGTYTRYFIYAYYYSALNASGCTFTNWYGGTVYWVYAYQTSNVTLSTSSCWMDNTYYPYGVYAQYYCYVTLTNCSLNLTNTYYSINMVYGYYYCPISLSGCYFNITPPRYTSTAYMVYGNQYCPININGTTMEQTDVKGGSGWSTNCYMVFGQTYSNISISDSKLRAWYFGNNMNYYYYPYYYLIYANNYNSISINNSVLFMGITGNTSYRYPYYPYYYLVYTTSYSPTMINNSDLNMSINGDLNAYPNYAYFYVLYANSYSPVAFYCSTVNQYTTTSWYYSYYYMFYMNSYSPLTFNYSSAKQSFDLVSYAYSRTFYMVSCNYYCPLTVFNSSLDVKVGNITSMSRWYFTMIYTYQYSHTFFNDSSVNMSVNANCPIVSDSTLYFMNLNYYSKFYANRSSFWLHNCSTRYLYGICSSSYGGQWYDNSTYICSDNAAWYNSYYMRVYCNNQGNLNFTWSKFIIINDTNINFYNSKIAYGIQLDSGGCDMENSTLYGDFQDQGPYATWIPGPDISGPYVCAAYLFDAYMTTSTTYYMRNLQVKFNFTNQSSGGVVFYWRGIIHSEWTNCYINITHGATGTSTWTTTMNSQVIWRMNNVTVEYQTKSPNYGLGGTMFNFQYRTTLYANDSRFSMRNDGGLFTFNMFRYCQGLQAYMENCSLDFDIGGGNGTDIREVRPNGLFGTTGAVDLMKFMNSTYTITVRDEPVLLKTFHMRASMNSIAFENSSMIFNMNAPGTDCNLIYFDQGISGYLGRLSLRDSTFVMNINRENMRADAFKIAPAASSTNGVLSTEVITSQFNISVNVATDAVCSGLNISGIKDVTYSDLRVNAFGPSRAVDPSQNTVVAGMRLYSAAAPTVENVTVKGNGQAKIYGIMCDIVAFPVINGSSVSDCYAGVYANFYSMPIVTSTKVSNCKYGLMGSWSSNITMTGYDLSGVETGAYLRGNSWVSLYDSFLTNSTLSFDLDENSTAWLLNTIFDELTVLFNDANSTLIVNWRLQLKVTWANADGVDSGAPIANAFVWLADNFGAHALNSTTDGDGMIPYFPILEYIQTRDTIARYSPYTANATFGGFAGQKVVTVNETKEVFITISDTSFPVLTIIDPLDGQIQNYTTVTLLGSASDTGSGIKTLSFRYGDAEWETIPAAMGWSFVMDVPEGDDTVLSVKLTDISGNEVSASRRVTIDLTNPFIKIDSPLDKSLGNSIGVSLNGSVEPLSALTVNFRPVSVADDGTFSYPLRLVEGKNLLNIFARDRAGNTNSTVWTLFLDITPPLLVVTTPGEGLLTNMSAVTVVGVAEPGADLRINNVPITMEDDGTFSVEYQLSFGTNLINITAEDAAGNLAKVMRTVVLDNELKIDVVSPVENMATNQITILVKGVIDTDCLLRLNDGIVAVGQDGVFSVTYALSEGLNTLVFSAVDRAGNAASVLRHVVLDTTRPALIVTSPEEGKVYKVRELTVKGTCESSINLTVNGQGVPTDTGSFSLALTLAEGSSVIEVIGTDAAGNVVTIRVPVLIDVTPPALEIVAPLDNFRTQELSVTVAGITEPGALVTVNGVPVTVDAFGKFTTSMTLERGKNTITVKASDAAGNEAPDEVIPVNVVSPAPAAADLSWLWLAGGLVLALLVVFPLTMLFVRIGFRTGKEEGLK